MSLFAGDQLSFFATTPKGIEPLLTEELRSLGALNPAQTRAGVAFHGGLSIAYRACLWSRLASRILLPLVRFPSASPDELYTGAKSIDWNEHLRADGSFAVDCSISQSQITHSHYAALKVKDAIVDQFRDTQGLRPSIDVSRPDIRVNVYIYRDEATLSLDLSGESLHRRGYREEEIAAPMKENLAAAILLYSKWPSIAREGGMLLDPMCGAGTLPIEGALMAADIAPGLLRSYFGFLGWKQHNESLWEDLLEEAAKRRTDGLTRLPRIIGYDRNPHAISAALKNVQRAGLKGYVHFERRDISILEPPSKSRDTQSLVVANPPYGERLGEKKELQGLYSLLGRQLRSSFLKWKAAVFTADPELAKKVGIRARRIHTLYNGAIECKLLHFEIDPEWFMREKPEGSWSSFMAGHLSTGEIDNFANRLRKNVKHIGRWARRNGISCYRVYDSDIPQFGFTVELYENRAYVYPGDHDSHMPEKSDQLVAVLADVLQLSAEQILVRKRVGAGTLSAAKSIPEEHFHEVHEHGCIFLVNFKDFPDTRLPPDLRSIRSMIKEASAGKDFLNLCLDPASATVHAAAVSRSTLSVIEGPGACLDWARRNLALNGLEPGRNECINHNHRSWLSGNRQRFDLILLNVSAGDGVKGEIPGHLTGTLKMAAQGLSEGGILFLVITGKGQTPHPMHLRIQDFSIQDITGKVIPPDCKRLPRIHGCWKVS